MQFTFKTRQDKNQSLGVKQLEAMRFYICISRSGKECCYPVLVTHSVGDKILVHFNSGIVTWSSDKNLNNTYRFREPRPDETLTINLGEQA